MGNLVTDHIITTIIMHYENIKMIYPEKHRLII